MTCRQNYTTPTYRIIDHVGNVVATARSWWEACAIATVSTHETGELHTVETSTKENAA